jgi:hypothetical protein
MKMTPTESLVHITEILHKHGIKYTLLWGTLLGITRDHKLIPWDCDIDIGVLTDDYYKLNWFKRDGYKLNPLQRCFMQTDIQAVLPGGTMIDFYEMFPVKTGMKVHFSSNIPISLTSVIKSKKSMAAPRRMIINAKHNYGLRGKLVSSIGIPMYKVFPYLSKPDTWSPHYNKYSWGFEFQFIPFRDTWVQVPRNAGDWLRLSYGDGWKVPNIYYADSYERKLNRKRKHL